MREKYSDCTSLLTLSLRANKNRFEDYFLTSMQSGAYIRQNAFRPRLYTDCFSYLLFFFFFGFLFSIFYPLIVFIYLFNFCIYYEIRTPSTQNITVQCKHVITKN